jgi:hypothetical protein
MRKNHDEQDFYRFYTMVYDYTMCSTDRLRGLYDAVMSVIENDIPGDIVECGTARGGSAALMGLVLKAMGSKRTLWVCDTFEGIPAATDDDPHEAMQYTGQFRGDIEDVEFLFSQLEIMGNCRLIKGMFQDTLPYLTDYGLGQVAVLHLDGDWYESTKIGLECLYDKVSPGGVIQIDDWGHWAGCQKAAKEFFFKRAFMPELTTLDYTGVQFVKGK